LWFDQSDLMPIRRSRPDRNVLRPPLPAGKVYRPAPFAP